MSISPTPSELETSRNELAVLRQELQELKRCQLHYFTLSITGTAAILGFAGSITNPKLVGPSLLAPLVIIIPCWWIFFDKATTITRIVGYVRILESLLANPENSAGLRYPGYEEALTLFREYEDDLRSGGSKKIEVMPTEKSSGMETGRINAREWRDLILLRTRHRYWMVNFYTFAGLSTLCCISSYWVIEMKGAKTWLEYLPVALGSVVTAVSLGFSIATVRQLTVGKRSYQSAAAFWKLTLSNQRLESGHRARFDEEKT